MTRRYWLLLAVAGVSLYVIVAMIGIRVASTNPEGAGRVMGPFVNLFTLAAIGFAIRAATHPRLDARTRSAWRWIAASYVLLWIAIVLFRFDPDGTFPRPADIAKIAMVPLLLIGLLRLPMRPLDRSSRLKLALDAGTVAAAAGVFLWYLLVGPSIADGAASAQRILAATAYPLENVALIFTVSVVVV